MESEAESLELAVKALQEIRQQVAQIKQHKLYLLKFLCFANVERLSQSEAAELYKDTTGEKCDFKDISWVNFDLSNPRHHIAVQEFRKYRLPFVSSIQLLNVPDDDQAVRDLMLNSIPNQQEEFSFNHSETVSLNGEKYFYELKEISIRITRTFRIWNTNFTQEAFWSLVNSAKRCKEVCFISCIIPTKSICDFGNMEGWITEVIDLRHTGGMNWSNWDKLPRRFTNILDGIYNSKHLESSLKQIVITDSYYFGKYKRKYLKKYDFKRFKFVEY